MKILIISKKDQKTLLAIAEQFLPNNEVELKALDEELAPDQIFVCFTEKGKRIAIHWYQFCIHNIPQLFQKYVKEDELYEQEGIYTDSIFSNVHESSVPIGYMKSQFNDHKKYLKLPKKYLKSRKFVLPEAWHVRVTKENQKVLSEWRGVNNIDTINIVGLAKIIRKDKTIFSKEYNPFKNLKGDNYTFGEEITFEQFKKYVLNEKV